MEIEDMDWLCNHCGNSEHFYSSGNGMICTMCGSAFVAPNARRAEEVVYIPSTESSQVSELARMFGLLDERGELPGYGFGV